MKDISELMLDRLLLQAEKLVELKFAIENIKSKFDTNLVDRLNAEIEGLCSVDIEDRRLTVICKTGVNSYKKHVLGRSDNVTFFVQQIDSSSVDRFNYKVIFKPESIVPDVKLDVR